jgi:hypothetical protein
MTTKSELIGRAQEYCQRERLRLSGQLGYGVHGIVFAVEFQSNEGRAAIKVHERAADYRRERDVYLRLSEHGVAAIGECAVPKLIHYDDQLWIIQMTVVTRPYVLDFAGAYLDHAPEFSEEVMADWRRDKAEQFEGRWGEVEMILRALEAYGVLLLDVSPSNISLAD